MNERIKTRQETKTEKVYIELLSPNAHAPVKVIHQGETKFIESQMRC